MEGVGENTRPVATAADRGLIRGLRTAWRLRAIPDSARSEGLVGRVLAARNLAGNHAISGSLTDLHDPSKMAGIDRAAERLLAALNRRERIAIYADYDVDGITAAAVLWHMLRSLDPEARITTFLPRRLEDGYGLNPEAVGKLCENHELIVSVDCGITAVSSAAVACERGRDLIITDHHTRPGQGQPDPAAYAIVHPGIPEANYPFAHLSGSGVAFKLAWRLATMKAGSDKVSAEHRRLLLDLLALTSMGVIADVVPLIGENRIIAKWGLKQMAHCRFPGIQALLHEAGCTQGDEVGAADIGFRLGPRLNAIGRLGHAGEALELLTTAQGERAVEIAAALTRSNRERQEMERRVTDAAKRRVLDRGAAVSEMRSIVLADESWHRGVVGICCSKLVEEFHRPTILMQREGDLCIGSARSIDGFDLYAAIAACGEHVVKFGGHAMAAGLTLSAAKLETFASAFEAEAGRRLHTDDLVGITTVDTECALDELSMETVSRLRDLAPFGRENEEPKVLLRSARLASAPRALGSAGGHLALEFRASHGVLRVKAWRWAELLAKKGFVLPQGASVDAVVAPDINTWNGRRSVEATLCDLRPL